MHKRFERAKLVGNQPGALSRKDSAIYLGGISTRQVDKFAAAGLIPRIKLGTTTVFRVSDLDRFLESRLQSTETE